jgi:hypothetical protein
MSHRLVETVDLSYEAQRHLITPAAINRGLSFEIKSVYKTAFLKNRR